MESIIDIENGYQAQSQNDLVQDIYCVNHDNAKTMEDFNYPKIASIQNV